MGKRPTILRTYQTEILQEESPTCKQLLAKVLFSNHMLDLVILLLVVLDLGCVTVESAIDLHLVCVKGVVVPGAPEQVVKAGNAESKMLEGIQVNSTAGIQVALPGINESDVRYAAAPARDSISALARPRRSKAMRRPLPAAQGRLQSSESFDNGLSQQGNITASALALTLKEAPEEEAEEPESLVCETKEGPTAHQIIETAHKLSVAILAVFTIEIFLKIYVAPAHFFSDSWEILDLVVVLTSLAFDTVIEGMFEEVLGVLIAIRLWRIVRLIHGAFEIHTHGAEEGLEEKH
jgi:hypothetical protein